MPAQVATTDFTVCCMPFSHREQGAMSTKGLRAALIVVGATSGGRIRVTSRSHHLWSEGAYLDGHPKPTKRQLDPKRS